VHCLSSKRCFFARTKVGRGNATPRRGAFGDVAMARLSVLVAWGFGFAIGATSSDSAVIVTGATGRTGSLLYQALRDGGHAGPVRALVRNVTLAREVLKCTACDESDGVYVGDVTDAGTLAEAFAGVNLLAIATGVHGTEPRAVVEKVEWHGVKNQIGVFLSSGSEGKRVLLISSMGTTEPPDATSNAVMFYKLTAEAFLAGAGVPFAIVKPCGLSNDMGGKRLLAAGHDDSETWFSEGYYVIPRADVARVAAEALVNPPAPALRFDLCAYRDGSTDAGAVLQSALLPWQKTLQGTAVV